MPAERVPAALRRVVAARAGRHCEYCHSPEEFATQSFTIEHILPRDRGGATTLDNLAWSCFGCNSHKSTRTQATDPEAGELSPFFNPRQQQWREHFEWGANATHILGRNVCGRATLLALRLNRPGLVNLRRVLAGAALHPPSEDKHE
jgi:hypothetical protein